MRILEYINSINKTKLKTSILISLFSIYFLYRVIAKEDEALKNSKLCFYDKFLLNYTNSINEYISQHLNLRDFSLLFSANCLDILMISFFFNFIKKGEQLQTIISLIMFYAFRGILQNFFIFSFYKNYLFDFPGFYSFSVPFFRAADFFYSGHCGFAYILTLSFRDSGETMFYYYGIFVIFLEFTVMTMVTRAHYVVDALCGIIFGKYFYLVSKRVVTFLQNKFKLK